MSNRATRKATSPSSRQNLPAPKTVDYSNLKFDIFDDLLSFYYRSASLALNRDYDQRIGKISLARGTGTVSTLLLVGANPGIRPSVIAHFILKDRSAMARLLDQLKRKGLMVEKVNAAERRAHELYLTPKGYALIERVRAFALKQSEDFFGVLSAAERAQLLPILKKLYESHIAEIPKPS